jgi:HAD superfamily hydrolase (TIGR01484 family)
MRDAAAFARDLGASFGLDSRHGGLLERAALLHDVGYAPALHRFGYHPLDGAMFLEERGEHPWIVEGVLRHSQADRKTDRFPGVTGEYARRHPLDEAAWLVRAVTVADWRAAGVGGRVSFARRFQDIAARNPHNPDKVRRAKVMVAEVRDWFLEWAADMSGRGALPWVFCDVDNTLVRPGSGLSAAARAAIGAYRGAGGRFSLSTGKHPLSIAPLVRELGLESTQVAGNGTCLLGRDGVTVLADLGEAADPLRAALEGLGLTIAVYREGGIEPGRTWDDRLDEVFDRYAEIRPVRTPLHGRVLKILCIADDSDMRREEDLRRLAAGVGADCCRSDRHFLEFVPRGGNKGLAARAAMELAGWPVLHSIALGATENAEPMFALCGACAAVDGASEEARRGADWVIGRCEDDGVARFLDRLSAHGGWPGLRSATAF